MLTVGLTGGIGSGKSTVARLLAARGAVIVDSDVIAREVLAPGSDGLRQVTAQFGPEVLAGDGSLDRERLGATVFGDAEARARLNAIVHPLVGERTAAAFVAAAEDDPDAIVVNDVPLLVEAGLADRYDVVVVVDAAPEVQLDRLTRLRGSSEADARARIAAQATREQRLAVATYVVSNDDGLDALDGSVRELWDDLSGRAGLQGGAAS